VSAFHAAATDPYVPESPSHRKLFLIGKGHGCEVEMSRADEIAQGLREEGGALTFPLDVLDYSQGHEDFGAGVPPPKVTSASYDLGRARARQKAEQDAEFWDWQRAEDERRERAMTELLKDHPEALAEYRAKMAEITTRKAPSRQPG
jgi:hypothetical protein